MTFPEGEMRLNQLRSVEPNLGFPDHRSGYRTKRQRPLTASFMASKSLPWLALIIAGLIFSVDFLAAAQQQRLLEVTVNRHIMASLKQDAEKPIDQSLRAHWITPDADGNIEGRISALDTETAEADPIGFLTVTLMKQGQEVSKSKTDREGRFVLEDVEAGVYTLLAFGKTGFLAYGVHVLPRLEELDLDEEFDLDVRNSDRTPLNVKQRQAWYVSHFNLPVDAVVAEELQIDAAAVPPEFTALEKISQNYLSASSALSIRVDKDDMKGIAKANLASGGFQFPLSPDGHFNGRLQPIATADGRPSKLSDMNLFLIQDDVEILRVAAEENGEFRMNDVEAGVYSLIAAGEDGFAALSLELVAAQASENGDEENANNAHPDPITFRRVSTAAAKPASNQDGQPKVNLPALGIAIVTDREDLRMISKTVERIANLRLVENGPPIRGFNGGNIGGFAPGGFGPGGFGPGGFGPGGAAPGGAAPGGAASAPSSFAPTGLTPAPLSAPPLTPGFGSAGTSLASGGGSILGLAGLVGGVVAVADDTSDPPPAASPSTIGN